MTTLSIQPPFPLLTDIDGQPLENGYIWIGVANLPPIGNPIAVYWDAALTQPAALPVRTAGGYPMNNGTPGRLYVNSDYSILVQNKNGSMVYGSLNNNSFFSGGGGIGINATGNGSQTIFPVSSVPKSVYINGVYQNQNSWSYAGSSVTFSEAPPATSTIEFLI